MFLFVCLVFITFSDNDRLHLVDRATRTRFRGNFLSSGGSVRKRPNYISSVVSGSSKDTTRARQSIGVELSNSSSSSSSSDESENESAKHSGRYIQLVLDSETAKGEANKFVLFS